MAYDPEQYQKYKETYRKCNQRNRDKNRLRDKERRRELKKKLVALRDSKCERCGFNIIEALEFHHVDPSLKSFNLNSHVLLRPKKHPWEEIVKEVEKCELLCANCHRIHHHVQG